MLIAAVSDVHSPVYFEEFVKSLESLTVEPDLFLLAGDMIHAGEINEYEKISNAFFGKIKCPIIACFGNTEFQQLRDKIKERYKNIRFLDDEIWVLEIKKQGVGIIGTTGSLDEPTSWQKRNIPNISKIYMQRVELVDRFLGRMINLPIRILLMHYSPTFKTLEGENPMFYESLGSIKYENVLIKRKPTLVIHGHSHKGTKKAWVDTVPIFNVAFPLNREIVLIDTDKDIKPGITKFV